MRLLIDVGNTQVKYVSQATETSSPLSDIVYLDYQDFKTRLAQGFFSHISEVILANVCGKEMHDVIQQWASNRQIVFKSVASEAFAFGVKSSYQQQPERLGVDRWLALIGAKQLYPLQNLLIVDAGTAMTIDILDAQGQHLGGWIMPGVQTLFNSLLTRTQSIVATPKVAADLSFGTDSSSGLNHGSWAMTIGAVKEAIIQADKLLTLDKILITGGNGSQISKLISDSCYLEPKLIFEGLSCFQAVSTAHL
ncbi:MAG: type III pantothenate kinase [Cognaticolwellia sp.]